MRFGRMGVMICYENIIPANWDQLKNRTDVMISIYYCDDDPSRHNIIEARNLGVLSA